MEIKIYEGATVTLSEAQLEQAAKEWERIQKEKEKEKLAAKKYKFTAILERRGWAHNDIILYTETIDGMPTGSCFPTAYVKTGLDERGLSAIIFQSYAGQIDSSIISAGDSLIMRLDEIK